MKHEKSLSSRILMTIVFPVVLVFAVVAGISMVVMSQNSDQSGRNCLPVGRGRNWSWF